MNFYSDADGMDEQPESNNQDKIEEEYHNSKGAETQDGNQTLILDIDKRKIEEELNIAQENKNCKSNCKLLNNNKNQITFNKNNNQITFNTSLFLRPKQLCQIKGIFVSMSQMKKTSAIFNSFQRPFQNPYFDKEAQVNLLHLAIVLKLNFEKLSKTEIKQMILDFYHIYIDQINQVLNFNCKKKKIQHQISALMRGRIIQKLKSDKELRNIKFLQNDYAFYLIILFESIDSVENLKANIDLMLDYNLEVHQKYKQFIQDEAEQNKELYKKKLQKFREREIIDKTKFTKGKFMRNIYNIIFWNLLQRNKQQINSILMKCFINNNCNWINLLDFKENDKRNNQIKGII